MELKPFRLFGTPAATLALALLLAGCAGHRPAPEPVEVPEWQYQNAVSGLRAVQRWVETDAVVRISNPAGGSEPGPRLVIGPLLPGEIALSASLPGLSDELSAGRYPLEGAFTVAASMTLVEPAHTTVALDLEYVPGISHCETDFSISRSAFARRIVDREPRDALPQIDHGAREWHYFTEVAGARRSLTLLHYWFADGHPVSITELPVEASARWRTWSTMAITPGAARQFEVFAVDRDSGCIAGRDIIRVQPAPLAGESGGESGPTDRHEAVAGYQAQFRRLTADFPATRGRQDVGVIELSSAFLAVALNQALSGARFPLDFTLPETTERPVSGALVAFAGTGDPCEMRDCRVQTECQVDFSRCQRKQDTRDCRICLFRNPLNNRCMDQRVDTDCEARKDSLNARYEIEWKTCMAREEAAQRECVSPDREAIEDCERKAREDRAACRQNWDVLRQTPGPFVEVTGQHRVEGRLSLVYSDLQIVGNLATLKAQITVEPEMEVVGELSLVPTRDLPPVAGCGWSGHEAFTSRIEGPQPSRRVAGAISETGDALSANWAGMTLPLMMTSGPLEAVYSGQSERFSSCQLGLTPDHLNRMATGEDGLFLQGLVPVDVLPGPASLAAPVISVRFGEREYKAKPAFREGQLRYELEE